MGKVGQPRIYKTQEEMLVIINEYFDKCDKGEEVHAMRHGVPLYDKDNKPIIVNRKIPKTMAGLAVELNIERQTLLNYMEKPEYVDIITQARKIIESENVNCALMGDHDSKIAALNLSSNFNYMTKTEGNVKLSGFEDVLKEIDQE